MYSWADLNGYQVCATYDTSAIESLMIDEMYEPVNPGTYTWSGKGITFGFDIDLLTLIYDTNAVSGQFAISDGDICVFSIATDDSLKIGKTEKNCLGF